MVPEDELLGHIEDWVPTIKGFFDAAAEFSAERTHDLGSIYAAGAQQAGIDIGRDEPRRVAAAVSQMGYASRQFEEQFLRDEPKDSRFSTHFMTLTWLEPGLTA